MNKANRRGFFGMLAAAGTATSTRALAAKPAAKPGATIIIYLDGKQLNRAIVDHSLRSGTEIPAHPVATLFGRDVVVSPKLQK